ncbi:DNA-binding protein, partial [Acidianus sp. RZ1]|uniref:NOB1 family endonuclease n=1 Tax=Acidianus sp. RZ1 TaxID=1540082 RepID=UPI0014916FF0|nr:DNA-binding protein [Acidianus sp. RZ1]
MEKIIFDTAPFVAGLENSFPKIYTTQDVIQEVKDSVSRHLLSLALDSGKIIILKPSRNSLETVKRKIKEVNDFSLSETDISVAAIALDSKPCVVFTDDLSLQNLLIILGINFTSVKLNKKAVVSKKFIYECKYCGYKTKYNNNTC